MSSTALVESSAAPDPNKEVLVAVGTRVVDTNGRIKPPAGMSQGAWAMSANEKYLLIMQSDGYLVFYQVVSPPPGNNSSFRGKALWWIGGGPPVYTDAIFSFGLANGDLDILDKNGRPLAHFAPPDAIGGAPIALWLKDEGYFALVKESEVWRGPARS